MTTTEGRAVLLVDETNSDKIFAKWERNPEQRVYVIVERSSAPSGKLIVQPLYAPDEVDNVRDHLEVGACQTKEGVVKWVTRASLLSTESRAIPLPTPFGNKHDMILAVPLGVG